MSEPHDHRALVNPDAAPAAGNGGFSLRAVLVAAFARAGLGAVALGLGAWILQESGFLLATGYGLPDVAARVLMLVAYVLLGAAGGFVHAMAGSALEVVNRVEGVLQSRLDPQMTGLLGRMFPNTPTITVDQIEKAVDRLTALAADPLRPGVPRMLLGWALRRGGAALVREARARAAGQGRLTLAEASALIREHLVRLVAGQFRSRLAIARQLAIWLAALVVLAPAAWLALRSA